MEEFCRLSEDFYFLFIDFHVSTSRIVTVGICPIGRKASIVKARVVDCLADQSYSSTSVIFIQEAHRSIRRFPGVFREWSRSQYNRAILTAGASPVNDRSHDPAFQAIIERPHSAWPETE